MENKKINIHNFSKNCPIIPKILKSYGSSFRKSSCPSATLICQSMIDGCLDNGVDIKAEYDSNQTKKVDIYVDHHPRTNISSIYVLIHFPFCECLH